MTISSHTFEGQTKVRQAIQKYLKARGMTSTRKIARFVEKETGLSVSPSTIARLVRGFGYERKIVEHEGMKEGEEWAKK